MATASFLDTRAARLLALGGIALIIAGMTLGDLFAIFVLHQNNARIGETMFGAAMNVPAGNIDVIIAQFQEIGGYLENRGTKVAAHTHAIVVGFVGVMLAVLQPISAWSDEVKLRLALTYIVCAVLLPVAVFGIHYIGLQGSPFQYFGWSSMVANVTGFILGTVVMLQLIGLYKGGDGRAVSVTSTTMLDATTGPSRTLMAGGTLLIVAGFLYGAGYAAYLQYGMDITEGEILTNIVSNAAAGNSVEADFGVYGGYQAFRGINSAAHAHVNTMALLLLVLALVQPYVSLSQSWKQRWANILVVSSALLPICILAEFKWGRVAGGVADVFGFLAIAALVAMLLGLVRRSDVDDSDGARVMRSENRILIFSGLALVVVTMFFGVYYAFFDEHQTLVGMGIALATSFTEAAAGNLEGSYAAIANFEALNREYRMEVHFHGHFGFLGLTLILLGLAVHSLGFPDATRKRLAATLALCAFLFPVGVLLQTGPLAGAGEVLASAGTFGLVLSMLVASVGILRRPARD